MAAVAVKPGVWVASPAGICCSGRESFAPPLTTTVDAAAAEDATANPCFWGGNAVGVGVCELLVLPEAESTTGRVAVYDLGITDC